MLNRMPIMWTQTKLAFRMKSALIKGLKKIKSVIFDKYLLYVLVPLGFIFEFLITLPFFIMCSIDNLWQKRFNELVKSQDLDDFEKSSRSRHANLEE